MAKNIVLDMEFLTSGMEQAIEKTRVVTNDLADGYFEIKNRDRSRQTVAEMLFHYYDSAKFRTYIIGDYLKELETQMVDLQKLVSRLIREGGEKQ
ncbi:hypothetical protein [uncultured Agathobaculum sp.]|uniref:hypothetical protein n=1 Tax=uncultured Agathobaculum sp. TaxID=2048140 RepID=UPI003209CA9D